MTDVSFIKGILTEIHLVLVSFALPRHGLDHFILIRRADTKSLSKSILFKVYFYFPKQYNHLLFSFLILPSETSGNTTVQGQGLVALQMRMSVYIFPPNVITFFSEVGSCLRAHLYR